MNEFLYRIQSNNKKIIIKSLNCIYAATLILDKIIILINYHIVQLCLCSMYLKKKNISGDE